MSEEFKTAFRKTSDYEYLSGMGLLCDERIFTRSDKGGFRWARVQDAWEVWVSAEAVAERLRPKFEAAFGETAEYQRHIDLGDADMYDIFDRHPEDGWYYHPSVALAWKFYNLGADV